MPFLQQFLCPHFPCLVCTFPSGTHRLCMATLLGQRCRPILGQEWEGSRSGCLHVTWSAAALGDVTCEWHRLQRWLRSLPPRAAAWRGVPSAQGGQFLRVWLRLPYYVTTGHSWFVLGVRYIKTPLLDLLPASPGRQKDWAQTETMGYAGILCHLTLSGIKTFQYWWHIFSPYSSNIIVQFIFRSYWSLQQDIIAAAYLFLAIWEGFHDKCFL